MVKELLEKMKERLKHKKLELLDSIFPYENFSRNLDCNFPLSLICAYSLSLSLSHSLSLSLPPLLLAHPSPATNPPPANCNYYRNSKFKVPFHVYSYAHNSNKNQFHVLNILFYFLKSSTKLLVCHQKC